MTTSIVVVGGANVDLKGRLLHRAEAETSNPGVIWQGFGGVGRNIAENLAVLGHSVRLVAAVGNDEQGGSLLRHLAGVGVDAGDVLVCEGQRTGTYLAVMDRFGELELAVADMSVMAALTSAELEQRRAVFTQADWVCIDANLEVDALETVTALVGRSSRGTTLIADPVSAPKSKRLTPLLRHIDVVTPSRDELAAMTGMPVGTPEEVVAAAVDLRERGVRTVVVTLGGEGVYYHSDGSSGFQRPKPVQVEDVTGAGDAFTAGLIHGLCGGRHLPAAVDFAQGLSARLVASTASVLTCDMV